MGRKEYVTTGAGDEDSTGRGRRETPMSCITKSGKQPKPKCGAVLPSPVWRFSPDPHPRYSLARLSGVGGQYGKTTIIILLANIPGTGV